MTELYYYEGLWWYDTDEGVMCCPPFVRDWPDVEKFFNGREVCQINKRRDENMRTPYVARNLHRHRCAQYDDKMRFVRIWPSVHAAALGTGLSTTSVRACLSGKIAFCKGKTFKRVNNE